LDRLSEQLDRARNNAELLARADVCDPKVETVVPRRSVKPRADEAPGVARTLTLHRHLPTRESIADDFEGLAAPAAVATAQGEGDER